jgi:hypothetical protein
MQVLSEGQRLKHDQYGMGEVLASDPERTSIDFDDHGTKLFVTSLMKAELIGEAPPKRTKVRRRRKAKVTVATAAPTAPPALRQPTPRPTAKRRVARAVARPAGKRRSSR